MSAYRLNLLDTPHLVRDAHPIPITRRKTMALLAFLAVTGAAHSRDSLATLLWPEYDQSSALANLRRELSRLRDILGTRALISDRLQVQINPNTDLQLDVTAFRNLLDQASQHAHLADSFCKQCLGTLSDAATLYQDDFMAGFSLPDSPGFDEWQFFQREELRRLLSEALISLIRFLSMQGEFTQAIPLARRWLAMDTLHEEAHRTLMKLYAWSGQQSAALRQYAECQRILKKELDLRPEDETQQLYKAIKTRQLPPAQGEDSRATSLNRQEAHSQPEKTVEHPDERAGQIPPVEQPALTQTIRFCLSPDGVRLAYAVVGEGPVLVKTANWLSHLEYDWNSPVWRHWMTGLARQRTLVRYDERGCGLSDWNVENFSLDAWVQDLETVVDTLGLKRFPLLGVSQGASIAIAYAVRHPEKVSHLILYGGYARGRNYRVTNDEQREELEVQLKLIRLGWGKEHPAFRQVFSMMFIPEGSPEQLSAFNELERITTSPEIAARIVGEFHKVNVSEMAKQITQPTLVLHAKDELRIPFEEGRLLASLIPNARLVPLDSKNHILLEFEPAWQQFLNEIDAFLSEG
jgi:DNA-binding SARP family transcriptional activator/pimeloyl-ACP methyl ester carboxylesterase